MGEFRVFRGNFKSKILLSLWTNIYAQNIQMRFKRILLNLQGPLQISRRRQSSQILGWDRQWRTLIPEKLEIRQKVLNRGSHEVTCLRRLIVRPKMRRCFLRISIRQRWRGMPLPSTPWNHRFLFFFFCFPNASLLHRLLSPSCCGAAKVRISQCLLRFLFVFVMYGDCSGLQVV